MPGYHFVQGPHATGITCHACNKTSYHPQDVKERYCGGCHVFHQGGADPPLADLLNSRPFYTTSGPTIPAITADSLRKVMNEASEIKARHDVELRKLFPELAVPVGAIQGSPVVVVKDGDVLQIKDTFVMSERTWANFCKQWGTNGSDKKDGVVPPAG